MAFQEAYKATSEGVRLDETAFTEGKKLGTALNSKFNEVNGRLAEMGTAMGEEMSGDGLVAANEAAKRELNDSIPSSFRAEYEAAEDDAEAAALVHEHILADVDSFITQKMEGVV